jgi:hypothetical protein
LNSLLFKQVEAPASHLIDTSVCSWQVTMIIYVYNRSVGV